MRRLSFLAALLGIGVAKAQDFRLEERVRFAMSRAGRKQIKPKNGECPLCGTMADPFKPEKETIWRDHCTPAYGMSAGLRLCSGGDYVDATPTSRRIDCAHCGVTFKQDAEHGQR